jgi:hypothetical protein
MWVMDEPVIPETKASFGALYSDMVRRRGLGRRTAVAASSEGVGSLRFEPIRADRELEPVTPVGECLVASERRNRPLSSPPHIPARYPLAPGRRRGH